MGNSLQVARRFSKESGPNTINASQIEGPFRDATLCWNPSPSTILLLNSIEKDNVEDLELALRIPDLAMNTNHLSEYTPLHQSLVLNRLDSVVTRLLYFTGINEPFDRFKRLTMLGLAVARPSPNIALELLRRGADVNVLDQRMHYPYLEPNQFLKTPLHCAVENSNLNAVCLLLYYGADVYATSIYNLTALKYALQTAIFEITTALINFYDFTQQSLKTDPFYESQPEEIGLLIRCLGFNCYATIFKLLWGAINPGKLLDDDGLNYFLITYIRKSRFAPANWLECLLLILSLYAARESPHPAKFSKNFFVDLFTSFTAKEISLVDRLSIITTCLSLGVPVTPDDYKYAHELYGFGGELEALIYANNHCAPNTNFVHPLDLNTITSFVLRVPGDLNRELFYRLLRKQFRCEGEKCELRVGLNYFLSLLGFYALSVDMKRGIEELCRDLPQNDQKLIFATLDKLPDCPTLFELCREEIRNSLERSDRYSYQFHDHVKKLKCPEVIHDVIRFKRAIYL